MKPRQRDRKREKMTQWGKRRSWKKRGRIKNQRRGEKNGETERNATRKTERKEISRNCRVKATEKQQ